MTDTMTAPPPQLLRTLTQRLATSIPASAKTISAVRPEVVVPDAADRNEGDEPGETSPYRSHPTAGTANGAPQSLLNPAVSPWEMS